MTPNLEIACFDEDSARIAYASGADRIELCSGLSEGGLTPDFELTRRLKQEINIPIFVMIRPRGGDFNYTSNEFIQMKTDIRRFKTLPVDGFVFGILNEDHGIDVERNTELVEIALPQPCTFHRAFERTLNYKSSLETIIHCGFKTLLTSGCQTNAIDGVIEISNLINLAKQRIQIMPGGGVRSGNIEILLQMLQTNFYHTSAILNPTNTADIGEIKKIQTLLKQYKC